MTYLLRALTMASLTMTLGTLGCGGPPPVEAKFSNLQPIFTRSCNFSSCHQSETPSTGNLSLVGTQGFCSLLGMTQGQTYRTDAKAMFPKRVVAGNRGQSYLYKKLTLGSAESGRTTMLGQRMPIGGALDDAEIDLVGRWIDSGATDDSMTAGPCK